MRKHYLVIVLSWLLAYQAVSQTTNLVRNGDFEDVTLGINSDFDYSSHWGHGKYAFTHSAARFGRTRFLDPKGPSTGRYLVVDSDDRIKRRVWYDSVKVEPNTTYIFSCMVANVFIYASDSWDPIRPSVIKLSVNGKRVGPFVNLTYGNSYWRIAKGKYTTGPDETMVEIAISNMETAHIGNDFALDNIFFGPMEIPARKQEKKKPEAPPPVVVKAEEPKPEEAPVVVEADPEPIVEAEIPEPEPVIVKEEPKEEPEPIEEVIAVIKPVPVETPKPAPVKEEKTPVPPPPPPVSNKPAPPVIVNKPVTAPVPAKQPDTPPPVIDKPAPAPPPPPSVALNKPAAPAAVVPQPNVPAIKKPHLPKEEKPAPAKKAEPVKEEKPAPKKEAPEIITPAIAFNKNIDSSKIRIGQKLELKHIYFERAKYDLTHSSIPELKNLVEFLNKYSNMKIRLEGHTDNAGDSQLNIELSEKRVKTVKKYLADHGIRENRIEYIGYGGEKPLNSNSTEALRRLNRRVEVVIIGK